MSTDPVLYIYRSKLSWLELLWFRNVYIVFFIVKILGSLAMVIFLFYQDMHNYKHAKSLGTADTNSQFIAILFFVITIIAILV